MRGHKRLKDNVQVSVEWVARQLYAIPMTNKKGEPTLQFSFSTKLVHMLRPCEPVYDRNIRAFFFLPQASAHKSLDKKLARLMPAYEFLRREYDRVIRKNLLL